MGNTKRVKLYVMECDSGQMDCGSWHMNNKCLSLCIYTKGLVADFRVCLFNTQLPWGSSTWSLLGLRKALWWRTLWKAWRSWFLMLILSRPLHGESLVYYLALIHASLANHEIKVSLLFFFLLYNLLQLKLKFEISRS